MGSFFSSRLLSNRFHQQQKMCLYSVRSRQAGIGLVGFIVGIVVGLAVALAVAVYITKVPTPFTDKGDKKTAQEQAAEEERMRSWNPNGPLASRAGNAPATTPDSGAPALPPDTTVDPQTGASATSPSGGWDAVGTREQALDQAKADAEAKLQADLRAQELARAKAKAEEEQRAREREQARANSSDDPIGALLQARNQQQDGSAARPSAAGNNKDPFVYYVQVGAFREQTSADAQRARLAMIGMSARVNRREQAGRAIYQVRLGPFNTKAEADSARSKAEGGGMETALVRVQR